MKNTKTKILQAALKLFNEQAYDQVTIRMIAQEMKISPGNLNYHYKKKEEILEALYEEMVAVFDQRIASLPQQEIGIHSIYEEIKNSMERMVSYRFFWTDLHHLLRSNEKINTHFQEVYHKRKSGLLFLFDHLQKEGLMKTAETQDQYIALSEMMLHYGNTWLYGSNLYQNKQTSSHYAQQYMLLFYPHFTDQGKSNFKKMISDQS